MGYTNQWRPSYRYQSGHLTTYTVAWSMSHGTTCGKRGRIFGSILYQIVSCITEYLEFRQFVQHALLVEPLLRGYLRGGGGKGEGARIFHSQRASSRAPAARAPWWACTSSIDKCDPFHIPSLENCVLLISVNAPSIKSEYITRPESFLVYFQSHKMHLLSHLGPSIDRNRSEIVSYSVVTYLPFHLSEA